MEGVEPESVRVLCPDLADELVGCEALEGLQAASKVVGRHEVIHIACHDLAADGKSGMGCKLSVGFTRNYYGEGNHGDGIESHETL